jgi:transposase
VWPPSWGAPLACATRAILSVACCVRWAGVARRLSSGPPKPRRSGHSALVCRALAGAPQKAADEGSTLVWGDEAGCSRLPLAVRTWAPRGQTPILHVPPPLTPDHLAAISGITLDGRLDLQTRDDAFDAQRVVGFLRVLLRTIRGKKGLVLWDGSPIHTGQPLKDFRTRGAAKRVHLERLPGYAPDRTPDEGIWNELTRVALQNRCCGNLAELDLELRRAKERLRHQRDIIQACAVQCGYSI